MTDQLLTNEIKQLMKQIDFSQITTVLELNATGQCAILAKQQQIVLIDQYQGDVNQIRQLETLNEKTSRLKKLTELQKQKIIPHKEYFVDYQKKYDLIFIDAFTYLGYGKEFFPPYKQYKLNLHQFLFNNAVIKEQHCQTDTVRLQINKVNLLDLIKELKYGMLIVKIPLYCSFSEYARITNEYPPEQLKEAFPDGLKEPKRIPISDGQQIIYLLLVFGNYRKANPENSVIGELAIEGNFFKRFPKINTYSGIQLQSMDEESQRNFQGFVTKRLSYQKTPRLQVFKIDFTQDDAYFYKNLRLFVQNNIKRDKDYEARADQKVEQFLSLFKANLKLQLLENKSMADIGSGDGVIAKQLAIKLQCTSLDIYEPFAQENTYFDMSTEKMFNLEFEFKKQPFNKTVTKKYDLIVLSASLHHVTNPEQVLLHIKKSLNPGGILALREHQPRESRKDQDKMCLDMQEKFYEFGFEVNAKDFDQSKMKLCYDVYISQLRGSENLYYNPTAYFTELELNNLLCTQLNFKKCAKQVVDTVNFDQNGQTTYMCFEVQK